VERSALLELLAAVGRGDVTADQAATQLGAGVAVADAVLDHAREGRTGVPEVVLGEWKSAAQLVELLGALAAGGRGALATRVDADKAAAVCAALPAAVYQARARVLELAPARPRPRCGRVAIVAAGTSDLPVVDEAAVTATFLGAEVECVVDVGVAGLHRLLERLPRLRAADVVVVVAGMEGALPSVVAGLVSAPVLAVPTSVGYGVGAGGLAALGTMLSSCAPGLAVLNIDNGFGAGVMAAKIARLAGAGRGEGGAGQAPPRDGTP
jgi:NCAIR mutase (PurE)-related protein